MKHNKDSEPSTNDPASGVVELVWREARRRFVAGFPMRSDSIGSLLGLAATPGTQGTAGEHGEASAMMVARGGVC